MKLELVNITNEELVMYNIPNFLPNSTVLIYDCRTLHIGIVDMYAEYKINNIYSYIQNDKILVRWNDFMLNKEYSLERLKYEMDFYLQNPILDKYSRADFLRAKRQVIISYLEANGNSSAMVRDLLMRYKDEISLYIKAGTSDLENVLLSETEEPYVSYLDTIVGAIPYLNNIPETMSESILRNIK